MGVTAIHEGAAGPGGGDLAGVDLRWNVSRSTRWKAETSISDTDLYADRRAWFTEVARRTGVLQGRAYFRELEPGFGLGQLSDTQVTHFRITPDGSFAAPSAAGVPAFCVKFRVLVQ